MMHSTAAPLTDRRAYEAAYAAHAGQVLATAYGVLRDRELAEDVVHDVFLELWSSPRRYDGRRGALGAYLRMLAHSRALDAWRRTASSHRARDRYAAEVAAVPVPGEDAADLANRASHAPQIRAAVRRLPAEQRQAIALAYWGGMSAGEIADRFGVPLGTVKGRLRLGVARLAKDPALAAAA